MKVAIVVGHTAQDQGADNKSFGLTEYAYNLGLSAHITKNLDMEFKVFSNIELSKLPKAVNEYDPDICINLHCNAFNKLVSGTETLYFTGSKKGYRLADVLHDNIVECLDIRDRGLKEIEGNERGGFILRKTKCPCVIIEPAFIDNDVDCMLLMENQEQLGRAIAEGVNDYFA